MGYSFSLRRWDPVAERLDSQTILITVQSDPELADFTDLVSVFAIPAGFILSLLYGWTSFVAGLAGLALLLFSRHWHTGFIITPSMIERQTLYFGRLARSARVPTSGLPTIAYSSESERNDPEGGPPYARAYFVDADGQPIMLGGRALNFRHHYHLRVPLPKSRRLIDVTEEFHRDLASCGIAIRELTWDESRALRFAAVSRIGAVVLRDIERSQEWHTGYSAPTGATAVAPRATSRKDWAALLLLGAC